MRYHFPLKDGKIEIPWSREIVEKRLWALMKKFKDKNYKDQYTLFMKEMLENNYAERILLEYKEN